MNQLELKDLYLGQNDGKKEAIYKDNFEEFFINENSILDQVQRKEKFLVLGRKGSGKTFLAHYMKKISTRNDSWNCDIRSYKDFKFQELVHLQTEDVKPNEYYEIWRWMLLLDLSRSILKDTKMKKNEFRDKIESFFEENYKSIDIDSKRIIEITKANKIRGSVFRSFLETNFGDKIETGSYLDYIEALEYSVIQALKNTETMHSIIYDELDDRFRNDDYYKNSILSLIKASDNLNLKLIENGIEAKAIILLRTDIFSILNDPDLNKIKRINAIVIEWGDKIQKSSPLIKMIITKAKKSSPLLGAASDHAVFDLLFPDNVNKIPTEKFLLERTFFRPRDLITFLNSIIEKHPSHNSFKWQTLSDARSDYSEYLLDEVRNEMSGHIPDIEIEESLKLIKNFNQHYFYFKDIVKYYEDNKFHYKNIKVEQSLIYLYKFSVLGNTWKNNAKGGRNYQSWSHRENNSDLDFSKRMVVHIGLREALSM
ncbi:P-loop ATPase, Sll1717 family [Vibrio anguillarum]|uniref:P-loop ATPase, Sll1717 family n=1 Tax=Vibrio anguillarum TaxID=55601 RepID=UPI000302A7FB|nr:hypothetical protein [Vibrio anguillarum]OEE38676.1 hypothetical protein A1QW_17230 [Vibrio anguillarum]OEF91501.1 hypothetical protein A1QY_00420 [Vibrio anguillarum]